MKNANEELAFPSDDYSYGEERIMRSGGMTLRDYFAAKVVGSALEHLWAKGQTFENVYTIAAIASYELADAMLKARNA